MHVYSSKFFLFFLLSQVYSLNLKTLLHNIVPQSPSKEYINLVMFIEENGGFVSAKLFPNEISRNNRFIMTKDDIKIKEELIFVPEKTLMSQLHRSLHKTCLEVLHLRDGSEFECIVYFMTIDKYNEKSFFRAYYNYLPEVDFNDFPSEDFLSQITNTSSGHKIIKELDLELHVFSRERIIKESLEHIKGSLRDFSAANNIKFDRLLADFRTNFFLVSSRNFGRRGSNFLEDVNTMVPYLDLLNHSDKYNTWWYYDDKRKGFVCYAVRDIKKGEEITDSYGKHDNVYLYSVYGFVLKDNIDSFLRLNIHDMYVTLGYKSSEKDMKNYFENAKKMRNIERLEAKVSIIKRLRERIEEFKTFNDCGNANLKLLFKEQIKLMKYFIDEFEKT